ncbi:MAG: 3'-5' exonuclease [Cyclobacteriaceae bacterium]|nr:3'-5' exonuclease [Cyclobacteriaceae bacterium]
MNQLLKEVLFLDIETVGCVDHYSKLSERLKTQWARKANFFKREEQQTDEDLFHEKAGIYAEFGKIVVIAVGKYFVNETGEIGLRTKYFAEDDEKKLLIDFKTMLEKLEGSTKLCAHNGKEFDFPYLSRRMLVNGIALPSLLDFAGRRPWEIPHLDTMELWKFGDYKHYTSLDLLTAIFNIPSSKGSMDGSMINETYYRQNGLAKIAEYCVGDVVAVAQLYLKMKGMNLIEEKNISRA